MVTHRGYTAEQEKNHHVWIYDSSGVAVCHMSYTKKLSDEKLRQAIDEFLKLKEKLDTAKSREG